MNVSNMGMRLFFKILLANGLSLQKIEKSTGIIRAELDNPRYKVPITHFMKLAEIGFKVTGDCALGLRLVNYADESLYGLLTTLSMNCDTLLEACKCWLHYIKLSAEANEVEIREGKDNFVIGYANISHYQVNWISEFALNYAVTICRKSAVHDFNPVEVRFQHPSPNYTKEYQNVFKAPLLFEQKENALVFNRSDLRRPIPGANPVLKKVLQEQANALLHEQTQTIKFKDSVRALIQKNIASPNLDICTVASELSMHRTTLYRKLSQDGTSFKEVLEEVRKSYALKYIEQDLCNYHIANLLGYSEPSAFQNAFKRWFRKSPGEYRRLLVNQAGTPIPK